MKKILFLFLLAPAFLMAQQRINSSFNFQTQNKLYSIYIPSGYNASTPAKLMLGLHPLNTARWNATSWCDTLVNFAEANNLLLLCPDGGPDGRIDDPIDTAFTSALLDSMLVWYAVDTAKTYVMGFSWGGLTTYTYGLNHAQRFGGFLPIGAAINGSSPIASFSANAKRKAVFIIHGGNDSPNTRYTPLVNEMNIKGAILNTLLMPGVGHTIDFPNRNSILTGAFNWIDSVNCFQLDSTFVYKDSVQAYNDSITRLDVRHYPIVMDNDLDLYPNPLKQNGEVRLSIFTASILEQKVRITDAKGAIVISEKVHPDKDGVISIDVKKLKTGTYIVEMENGISLRQGRLIIE